MICSSAPATLRKKRVSSLGNLPPMSSTAVTIDVDLSGEADLREVLHQNALPIAIFDLESMQFVDANAAARALVGLDEDAALPETVADIFDAVEEERSAASLRLLADGAIIAFEARRRLQRVDGTTIAVHTWVRSLDVLRAHSALIVIKPRGGDSPDSFTGELPSTRLRLAGPVVVGSLDLDMRVRRLANDVAELLGEEPEALIGQPLVERIHRDDVGAFLLSLGRAMSDDQGAAMHVRMRHANGDYIRVRLVVTPTSGDQGTRLGLVITAETFDSSKDARVGELERHLWRIALEVQAAGVVDGLQRLPDPSQVPGLADLSSRQWDIVTRLLRGERVPDIARATSVSQSTVRNQLGLIYQKVGVHSQAELLALLRGTESQTV
jgi:PAS domain S-box-containing protein